MTGSPKRDGKVIHPRIPDDLHAALVEFADRTNRSLNGAVVQLLSEALDARARGVPTPPEGTSFTPAPTHTR